MPHSSGGGHHGGGFHFGGGFHSSSFSDASLNDIFNDNEHSEFNNGVKNYTQGPRPIPHPRRYITLFGHNYSIVHRRYTRGLRTFVYYRHHCPHYLFTYDKPTEISKNKRIAIIIGLAILTILFIWLFCLTFNLNEQYVYGSENNEIKIVDKVHAFNDTTDLNRELNTFKENTGITPYIATDYNSTWNTKYSSLESYALDLYVDLFGNDETCWLIVYTNDTSNDWYFECMQGNYTDNVLTKSRCNKFIENLYNYLEDNSEYTVSEAFAKSFNNLNKVIASSSNISWPLFILFLMFSLASLTSLVYVAFKEKLLGYKNNELVSVGVRVNKKTGRPDEAKCEYCGGMYVKGIHNACPHCGGSIIYSKKEKNQKKKNK